ncbi:hypothetical protein Y032_0071g589 [Ancylostoma ceylanicum]|nr:hypothetical protein Y032_0071g589 [Ancylostoma ceylanicum]
MFTIILLAPGLFLGRIKLAFNIQTILVIIFLIVAICGAIGSLFRMPTPMLILAVAAVRVFFFDAHVSRRFVLCVDKAVCHPPVPPNLLQALHAFARPLLVKNAEFSDLLRAVPRPGIGFRHIWRSNMPSQLSGEAWGAVKTLPEKQ